MALLKRSMRKLAAAFKVSDMTVQRVLKSDLKPKAYHLKVFLENLKWFNLFRIKFDHGVGAVTKNDKLLLLLLKKGQNRYQLLYK